MLSGDESNKLTGLLLVCSASLQEKRAGQGDMGAGCAD